MTEIVVDVDLGHPPERVWRALTDSRTLSQWFMRTDLEPREGSRFQLIPEGLLGLTDPLDGELVEVSAPRRLAMLWRGEQLHARVVWELEPTLDGCRLRMRHTGFLGVKGSLRRRELADMYEHLVRDRLPAVLHELSVGKGALVPAAAALPRRPLPAPESLADEPTHDNRPPPRPGLLARLVRIPHRRRGQLLALAGAAILAVVTAAVISSLGVRPFTPPLGAPDDYPYDIPASAGPDLPPVPTPASQPQGSGSPQQPGGGPNSGGIPGAPNQPPVGAGGPAPPGAPGGGPGAGGAPNPPPGPPGAPPPPPAPPGSGNTPAISASYTTTKTIPPGYHSEVTVENRGTADGGWSVTVIIQSGAKVEGVKGADYTVDGTTVTFTPDHPGDQIAPGGSVLIRFHVKSKGASRPVDCKVNGQECAGL